MPTFSNFNSFFALLQFQRILCFLAHCVISIVIVVIHNDMFSQSRCLYGKMLIIDKRTLKTNRLHFRQDNLCQNRPSRNSTPTKSHSMRCLNMHRRLQLPETTLDISSFLLNKLSNQTPHSFQGVLPWFLLWPTICTILYEPNYLAMKKFRFHRRIILGKYSDSFPNFSR